MARCNIRRAAAYTMNPPGFPGESVDELKDVQAFDPKLAKQLMAEAGFRTARASPS